MLLDFFRHRFRGASGHRKQRNRHGLSDVVARARNGESVDDIAEAIREEAMADLADSRAALREDQIEIDSRDAEASAFSIENIKDIASSAVDQLLALAVSASDQLKAINAELAEAKVGLKAFVHEHGLAPGHLLPVRPLPMILIVDTGVNLPRTAV